MASIGIVCMICGRTETRGHGRRVTCGRPECIKEQHEIYRRTWRAKNAHRRATSSRKVLSYSIMSPDGSVYDFSNLRVFIRDNIHLFDKKYSDDGDVGVEKIAVCLRGLRPRPNQKIRKVWQGWRWRHEQALGGEFNDEVACEEGSNNINEYIGALLSLLRVARRLTASEVGRSIGVSYHEVRQFERGRGTLSAARLYALATLYKVPIDYFFKGIDDCAFDPLGRGEGAGRDDVISLLATKGGTKLVFYMSMMNLSGRRVVIQYLREFVRANSS